MLEVGGRGEGVLTSVTISMKRQKAKKIPKSILVELLLVREGVWGLQRG